MFISIIIWYNSDKNLAEFLSEMRTLCTHMRHIVLIAHILYIKGLNEKFSAVRYR